MGNDPVSDTSPGENDRTFGSERIYCANCGHCKIITAPTQNYGKYYLRVRCAAGKWIKKLGEEKVYKYFTVIRRNIAFCDAYDPMGDPKEFLRDLKNNLPMKDEIYTL